MYERYDAAKKPGEVAKFFRDKTKKCDKPFAF